MSFTDSLFRDQAQRHQETRISRFILERMIEGAVVVDRSHTILAATPQACLMFGCESVTTFRQERCPKTGECTPRLIESLLEEKDQAEHASHFDRWFQQPRRIDLKRRDGKPITCQRLDNQESFPAMIRVEPFDTDECNGLCLDGELGEVYAVAFIVRLADVRCEG